MSDLVGFLGRHNFLSAWFPEGSRNNPSSYLDHEGGDERENLVLVDTSERSQGNDNVVVPPELHNNTGEAHGGEDLGEDIPGFPILARDVAVSKVVVGKD